MTHKVRSIEAQDLPALLPLIQGLAAHHGDRAMVTIEDLERDCIGPHPWLDVIVLERGGVLRGYAALFPMAQLQFGLRGMELHHLFVQTQGQGDGARLLRAAMDHAQARGAAYLSVGTAPDNIAAQGFYTAQGMELNPGVGPRFRIRFESATDRESLGETSDGL